MPKRTDIEGYSVIVFVETREEFSSGMNYHAARSPEQARAMAEEIKAAIKRHLSHDFQPVHRGPVDIEAQVSHVCGSCGSPWTEKNDNYNGGCCEQDEADHEQAKADNGQFGVGA